MGGVNQDRRIDKLARQTSQDAGLACVGMDHVEALAMDESGDRSRARASLTGEVGRTRNRTT